MRTKPKFDKILFGCLKWIADITAAQPVLTIKEPESAPKKGRKNKRKKDWEL